jgi:cytochrome c biogenesis protein CcmG/thiol:disulfide interchange protein DsbE
MTRADLRRAVLLAELLAGGVVWAYGRDSPHLSPGAAIGEVSAELAGGDTFVLSQHRGEVVVLNFWATWCMPCREEAPLLNALHARGVRVVGLAVDPLPLPAVAAKAHELGMRYPIGLGSSDLTSRLGIRAVPTTCVIGKDGSVVQTLSGIASQDELDSAIAAAQSPRN